MLVMDEIDNKILEILKRDARKPFVEIGKELGLSEGAVRRRVKNLIKNNVITRFTIEVEKGHAVRAITFVTVDPGTPTPLVSEKLASLDGVESVYELTGEYDVAAVVSANNVAGLNKCIEEIRKIDGVRNTNTVLVLRVVR
ncbi:MAG: transcriptional regulator [Candidatus Terraquivivens tikiterensis]|uniref:Transcriptional regulator n=1 Tax=Candidatus Terraquivivens tikiterensis TaxID=1980982 RepID=A0A2R7Y1B1_9ARCH|nr:MAG: transcriptional regulator [Candidatus Terraquivivens tikiterensis]